MFFRILLLFIISINCYSGNYIPYNAFKYIPILIKEQKTIFPEFTNSPYFSSLIEQESCIYLTASKCWDPKSRLKTSREEGAGLSQLTRAYRKNGTLRFDTVRILRTKYNVYLKELTWDTVYQRPDLQIRGMILLWKDGYEDLPKNITNKIDRIAMADAAYNGGMRGVIKDRRLCGLTKNCNPNIWFDNIENTCSKSKRILYGNRSACDINRDHVKKVLKVRYNKYNVLYSFFDI